MLDLRKKTGGAVINNEDKTITANGEYTASEGYTGLGTVTVAVSGGLQKNYYNVNATVDSNGIASGFNAVSGTYSNKYGGIQIVSPFIFFPDGAFSTSVSTIFQLKFKTPKNALSSWEIPIGTYKPNVQWGSNGGNSDFICQIHNSLSYFKIFGLGMNGITINYTLQLDTWYIIQVKGDGVYISEDDGATFTRVNSSGAVVSLSGMRNSQIGYSANWNASTASASACLVDLTKTGWIDTTNNLTYMLAE